MAGAPRVVELLVNPGPTAPAAARGAVDCLGGDVPPDGLVDLRLIASELVTYGVLNGAGAEEPMRLRLTREAPVTRLEIESPGPSRDIDGARRLGRDASAPLRLRLIERVADRWGAELRRGPLVWLEIHDRSGARDARA
jgi:hypothetical protein